MAQLTLPDISHYITSYNPDGRSVYLNATNPPPPYSKDNNHRIDYVYSLSASATGPALKDDVDYEQHQIVATTPPHILFPAAGASAAVVVTFAPNQRDINSDEGLVMHRTNTLDYVFIIEGELELTLDSGEKRIMRSGDVCIQRASMHAWKNMSSTDIARFGAVCIGFEGAKLNEMIFPQEDLEKKV